MKHGTFSMIPRCKRRLQCKQPTSPRSRRARVSKSQIKTMLITFFDIKGIIHFEFVPQSETVNQAYYVEILKKLRGTVHRKKA